SDNCNNIYFDTVNVSFYPNTLELKDLKDTSVCTNVPVTLYAQVSGAATPYIYNWCPQGMACSTLPNPVFTFYKTTQVILEITATDFCKNATQDTMTVYVFPLRQIAITASKNNINKGDSVILK